MKRSLLLISMGAAAIVSLPAAAQTERAFGAPGTIGSPNQLHDPALNIPPERREAQPARIDAWNASQLVRWGAVGRCVAARDRDKSAAYVMARRGSADASAAAKGLAPAFTACLDGSGIRARDNAQYRRAALADALGIAPAN